MSSLILATFLLLPGADRPNVLWLTCEDMGPHLGFCGDMFARTPHLDSLAKESIHFTRVWSHAPVCAPARTGLILGRYATSVGAEPMRSMVPLPAGTPSLPSVLRKAGYYCTNNSKEDYNVPLSGIWDASSNKAHYRNRKKGQPFFAVFNNTQTHESQIRNAKVTPQGDSSKVPLPPYHPDLPGVRQDWNRYYENIATMDGWVGNKLAELKSAGLDQDTVVFFFSDHGSGMPRSKRWPGNSGLHVPLLVRIPEKWKARLLPDSQPGTRDNRLIGFVDMAPTVWSICGAETPPGLPGLPFLGGQSNKRHEFLAGYRSRMDERIDLARSIRDGRFVYIRNYHLHRPHGQHVTYQFETPTTRLWKAHFDAGKCDVAQSRFWEQREPEELYDLESDPHEVRNLAADQGHAKTLTLMRERLARHLTESRDVGLMPEGLLESLRQNAPALDWAADARRYPVDKIQAWAGLAAGRSAADQQQVAGLLTDTHPVARYWGAIGVIARPSLDWSGEKNALLKMLEDPHRSIRIAAASALAKNQKTDQPSRARAVEVLRQHVNGPEHGFALSLEALDALDSLSPEIRGELTSLRAALGPATTFPARVKENPSRLLEHMEGKLKP